MHSLFQDEDDPAKDCAAEGLEKPAILVPFPVDKPYSYTCPPGMTLRAGDYVRVPLGSRAVAGVVWERGGQESSAGGDAPKKLKSVAARYDIPAMPAVHRAFIDWVASYTMAARGAVLKLSLSVPAALEGEKLPSGYRLKKDSSILSLPPKRQAVCDLLRDGGVMRAADITAASGCSSAVLTAMAAKGLLEKVEMPVNAPCRNPEFDRTAAILSSAQKDAANQLIGNVNKGSFSCTLLDGVTGAGKTEVYFEAVAAALRQGRQVLILLPEIALSNAFMERFTKRFGCAPALWHSSVSPARRRRTWRGVALGETRVVVGARSALFLPFSDLGLIVVDEEHDAAYKQEDGVIYHARDMAVVRAHLGGIPAVLVSATPSLETMHNAMQGRYGHILLPERHGGAKLPAVTLIDMKGQDTPSGRFLSPALITAVHTALDRGEQSLLFLNRRGYAPLTLCRACGHRFECPRCTAWMVEHRRTGKLHCHHCGHAMGLPSACPACGAEGSLVACGPGVERVLEEVKESFPDARSCVLSSDTADTHEKLSALLSCIHAGNVDIIIGTQIIAKGHHFPRLTCVGVVDADLGLTGGDLRATERTYQLLHQVAGRAGREEAPGTVYLQSYNPGSRVLQALQSGSRDAFIAAEEAERQAAHMPPFSRLAGIIVSGRQEEAVANAARELGRRAPHAPGIATFGPAEAPIYRLRGTYRRRLLVRADKNLDVQKALAHWLAQVKLPSSIRVQVDIDPQSFL